MPRRVRADPAASLHDGSAETGLESELGWSLHRVSAAFRRSALSAVADLPGGPRGYQLLVAVREGPAASQLALAERLDIDKTAMTYLVDDLEQAGLVTRRANPADRRVRHLVLTDDGQAALGHSGQALRTVEQHLFGALDDADAATLHRLLGRVARSTNAVEPCTTGDLPG